MNESPARYEAFITYRHLPREMAVAKRLQHLLETYRPPRHGSLPRQARIGRVFRDQSELPTSSNLGQDIRTALEQTRFLIVICSPRLMESKYCMAEIEYFRALHGGRNDHILTVLAEGEPAQAYPPALLRPDTPEEGAPPVDMPTEPLGADVRAATERDALRRLRTEYLRIAAPLLGCGFDDLYQREQRRRVRRRLQTASTAAVAAAVVAGYALYMNSQIAQREQTLLRNESYSLSYYADEATARDDEMLAMLLAMRALPEDLDRPQRPLVPEAEAALRSAVLQREWKARQPWYIALRLLGDTQGPSAIAQLSRDETKVSIVHALETYVFDTHNGALLHHFPTYAVYFNEDFTRAAALRGLFALTLWDLERGVETARIEVPYDDYAIVEENVFFDETNGHVIIPSIMERGEVYAAYDAQGNPVALDAIPEDLLREDSLYTLSRKMETYSHLRQSSLRPEDRERLEARTEPMFAEFAGEGLSLRLLDAREPSGLLLWKATDARDISEPVLGYGALYALSFGETFESVYSAVAEYDMSWQPGLLLSHTGDRFYDQVTGDGLIIGQVSPETLAQRRGYPQVVDMEEVPYPHHFSPDGRRALEYDYALRQLTIRDTRTLQPLFSEPAEMLLASATPDLSRVLLAQGRTLACHGVTEAGSAQRWTQPLRGDALPLGVALRGDGQAAAVAYADGVVEIRTGDLGGEAVTLACEALPELINMELTDDWLLLMSPEATRVYAVADGAVALRDDHLSTQIHSFVPKLISADGLMPMTFFNTQIGGTYYDPIDLATGARVLPEEVEMSTYAYSPESGYFACLEIVPLSYGTGVSRYVTVYQQRDGVFTRIGSLEQTSPDMSWADLSMDAGGQRLLIANDNVSELYDLPTMRCLMRVNGCRLALLGDSLYDLGGYEAGYPMQRYDLLALPELVARARALLTSTLGERTLSEAEALAYFLKTP